MAEWFSIEVMHGSASANGWVNAHGDQLVNAAFGEGATDWVIERFPWGVVLEFEFPDEATFERYRTLPAVVAALENVPDSVNGLLVHRGRGGSSGSRRPLRPIPIRGSGSAALPIPVEESIVDDVATGLVAQITMELTDSTPISRIA